MHTLTQRAACPRCAGERDALGGDDEHPGVSVGADTGLSAESAFAVEVTAQAKAEPAAETSALPSGSTRATDALTVASASNGDAAVEQARPTDRCGAVCETLYQSLSEALCLTCRLQPPAFDATVAGCLYTWPTNRLIHQLKSRPSPAAAQALARMLHRRLTGPVIDALALPPDTVLVPIPSRVTALRERGFNPALRLAQALSVRMHWPVRGRWLRRQPHAQAKPQHMLSRDERVRAAMGAHVCVPARVSPCTVALVDDVMTTGATLDDAARALRRAGARRVVVLVAARAWI